MRGSRPRVQRATGKQGRQAVQSPFSLPSRLVSIYHNSRWRRNILSVLLGFNLLVATLGIVWLLLRQRSLAQRLRESERRFRTQEQSLRLLGEAGQALAASLDYEKTLRSVARLAVQHIADWCLVDVLEDGKIHHTAIGHADPSLEGFARDYLRRYPPDPNGRVGLANVIRTGEPELVPKIPDSALREFAESEEHLRTLRQLGMHSVMTVPMISRGRTLGAITLVAADSGRRAAEAPVGRTASRT